MNGVVEIDGVSLRRDPATLLDSISWTIAPGEHSALIGGNGSGKTTLLKVMTGYEWPSQGTVRVLGKTFGKCDVSRLRRTIGWMSASIEPRMPRNDTVARVVASGFDGSLGLYRPLENAESRRVACTLERMGIAPLQERPFAWLSQGERVRTLIARALVHNPRLLVLDEPCAGLDAVARARLLDDMASLVARDDPPTILLVTHHIEEISPWIQTVHAMRAGKTVALGDPARVLCDTVMTEVFGAPVRVEKQGAAYRLVVCARRIPSESRL